MSLFWKSLTMSNDTFKKELDDREYSNITMNISALNSDTYNILTNDEIKTNGNLSSIMSDINDIMYWSSTLPTYGPIEEHIELINSWHENRMITSYLFDQQEELWFGNEFDVQYNESLDGEFNEGEFYNE